MALERDRVLGDGADSNFCYVRQPPVNKLTGRADLQATVVYKDRPLRPGDSFLPDELIVKVMIGAGTTGRGMFSHHEFPSQGTAADCRAWFNKYQAESDAGKLSDFNLLVFIWKSFQAPPSPSSSAAAAAPMLRELQALQQAAQALKGGQSMPADATRIIIDGLRRISML